MPTAKNESFIALRGIRVTQDICGSAKWDHEFSGSSSSSRTSPLWRNSQRPYGTVQSIDQTACRCGIFILKERSEPLDIERRRARKKHPHSLRGFGLGSSLAVPQLS